MKIGPYRSIPHPIVLPPALAWATEALSNRHTSGTALAPAIGTAMVPLVTVTLFVVVSLFPKSSDHTNEVMRVVPIFAASLVLIAAIGLLAGKVVRSTPHHGRR